MSIHYIYRDGNNFKIRGNANKDTFYVHTSGVTIGVPTGIPGMVQSFTYFGDSNVTCNLGNTIYFSWTPPSEDEGGNTITGYAIRRIGVEWIGSSENTTITWSGQPYIVPSDFYEASLYGGWGGNAWCVGDPPLDTNLDNPVSLSNVNSISIDGWECGVYSFQIAAINASGTGNWYPTEQDFDTITPAGSGYTTVGDDRKNISISGGSIVATYFSDPEGCSPTHPNFQSVSGELRTFPFGSIVATYLSFTRGTVTFSKGGLSGWYYVNITEFYTDYLTSCQTTKNGCLPAYIYVT